MYAKNAWVDLPAGDGEFGYDLFAGDLVVPYGIGQHSDFIFKVSTTNSIWHDRNIYHLQADIVFPNPNDGIQVVFIPSFCVSPSSNYRLPFSAPDSGYVDSLSKANGNTQSEYRQSNLPVPCYWTEPYHLTLNRNRVWMEEVNYFFKIRSDASGHANYGIIRGILRADYRGGNIPCVEFEYYVNPDGTQNVEFDPTHNLMKRFSRNPIESKAGIP
jgi:hypothetical protein